MGSLSAGRLDDAIPILGGEPLIVANQLGFALHHSAVVFTGDDNAHHASYSNNVACQRQKWKSFRPPNGLTMSRAFCASAPSF